MKNLHPRTQIAAYLATVCFALGPIAFAVEPPPDGGYPNANTAEGKDALYSLTTGPSNTAAGYQALYSNTTGSANTALGSLALSANTSSLENTALGFAALRFNTTGAFNTATGAETLQGNTTGMNNTADGYSALRANTTGSYNIAVGVFSLVSNSIGVYNTAVGYDALLSNETGGDNIALGTLALWQNKNSYNNIAIGSNAGSAVTGNDNIFICNPGQIGDHNRIRIGTNGTHRAVQIAGISGVTVANGVGVIIGNHGQLGTIVSSKRFKDGIHPMNNASEAILSLKPVTFRYKKELDPEAIPQFGLVAEDVARVNPDLVARDEQGKPYTVRYEAVNAMLLNEFLKEHRKVEEQGQQMTKQDYKVQEQEATLAEVKSTAAKQATTIAQQQKEIQALTVVLKTQAAQIQKVSDLLTKQTPAARLVTKD